MALISSMALLASPTVERMALAKSEDECRCYFMAFVAVIEFVMSEIPELSSQLQADQVAKDLIDSAKKRRDGEAEQGA